MPNGVPHCAFFFPSHLVLIKVNEMHTCSLKHPLSCTLAASAAWLGNIHIANHELIENRSTKCPCWRRIISFISELLWPFAPPFLNSLEGNSV